MLKTAATVALVIFHLVILTIIIRKLPMVIRAVRRSRFIAGLGMIAVLALVLVAVAHFAVHSRPLTIAAAVVTMVSFILTFKLSTRVRT
jgi:hypothetical protein